jgi:DNA excision repair protein ERCC-3
VATNIETESIVRVLNRFSKNALPEGVAKFIRECTKRYGKAKLVLKHNKFYVESEYASVLRELLRDDLISQARVAEETDGGGNTGGGVNNPDGFVVHTKAEEMEENLRMLREMDGDSSDDEEDEDGDGKKKAAAKTTVSFQVKGDSVEVVKRRAIDLDYPLMEEYDFRNDKVNPDVPMDLKPHTRIRRYQERSLSKVSVCVFIFGFDCCIVGMCILLTHCASLLCMYTCMHLTHIIHSCAQ